jgi:DNA-binding MarR family transcriptional regulator
MNVNIKNNVSALELMGYIRDSHLVEHGELIALYTLVTYCGGTLGFQCSLSPERLAQGTGLSKITLQRALKNLEKANLIAIYRRSGANMYMVNLEPIKAAAEANRAAVEEEEAR